MDSVTCKSLNSHNRTPKIVHSILQKACEAKHSAGLDKTAHKNFYMEYRVLGSTGLRVSRISLGGTAFAGFFGEKPNVAVINRAIELGVNYFDIAPWYTNSEALFGGVFKASNLPRQNFHVATKVGRYQNREDPFDFSADTVRESVYRSLDIIGVDYVDLIQVHDLEFSPSIDIIVQETLPMLQELREKGLIKNIGIAGYDLGYLMQVVDQSSVQLQTILSYCRATLQDSTLVDPWFHGFFQEKDLGIINASINGMGVLSPKGPADWHPGSQHIKDVCQNAAKYCEDNHVSLPRLTAHFASTHDFVVTNIISTNVVKELEENIESFIRPLNEKEEQVLEKVKGILAPVKNQNWEHAEVAKYWRKKALQVHVSH